MMDSRAKEREARDHRYEEFMYEQVSRYADLNGKVAKVYTGCAVACIVLAVAGIFLGKSFLGALCIGLWSLGFFAANRYYVQYSADIRNAAAQIRAAIDDPDFDIPDDYPEEILDIRQLVCPTLKNVRSQGIAYGIIAVFCWAGMLIILWASTMGGFSAPIFISGIIMGAMALMLTLLSIRAWKDIPVAKAYEEYLNAVALDE